MRPVPQAKDWLPCQPLGSFVGKAALTLCYCWTGPDQASRSCSQAKNLMACFTQHWATAISKSWQQKPSHFTAVLHSQKRAEFGPLLSSPDLFKQMSHDQELKQNLGSCEQYSSHVIIIIFLSGTSEVLVYSRKTESRKAASVCTHPHTEAPILPPGHALQPTAPNIHNLPTKGIFVAGLVTGSWAALCTAKGWDSSSLEPKDPMTAVICKAWLHYTELHY